MRNGFLRFSIRGGLALTLLVSASGIAEGCFAPPADVPVDRLITNVGAYIKDHPWEAQGFYTLARLHSLAFSYRRNKVYSYGDTLPNVDHPFHPAKGEAKPGEALTDAEAQAHLDAALKNFEQAIRLDGTKALFHNGLAYTLEAAAFSSTAPPPGVLPQPATKDETAAMEKCVLQMKSDKVAEREAGVKALSEFGAKALTLIETQMKKNDADLRAQLKSVVGALWMEKAIAEYLEAYRLAIGDDSKIGTIPLYGINSLVSYEAGHKYIELTKARGLHELEKKNVASITEGLALLGHADYFSARFRPAAGGFAGAGGAGSFRSGRHAARRGVAVGQGGYGDFGLGSARHGRDYERAAAFRFGDVVDVLGGWLSGARCPRR